MWRSCVGEVRLISTLRSSDAPSWSHHLLPVAGAVSLDRVRGGTAAPWQQGLGAVRRPAGLQGGAPRRGDAGVVRFGGGGTVVRSGVEHGSVAQTPRPSPLALFSAAGKRSSYLSLGAMVSTRARPSLTRVSLNSSPPNSDTHT